jgi:PAS domain S-box-containing protein
LTRALWPLPLSARRMVPLFLLVTFLCLFAVRYLGEMERLDVSVMADEQLRLRERLNTEQTRLDFQAGLGQNMLVRRVVGGLGLYSGLERAYLVDRGDKVQASLSRRDLGQPVAVVLARDGRFAQALGELAARPVGRVIEVDRYADSSLITALVPVQTGERLLVVVDAARPLLARRAELREELVREGLWLLMVVGLLAWALHRVWFRRAERLARALSEMGAGRLDVRTGVTGRDELALIGEQADRMAERLQAEQGRLQKMTQVVDRSPVVVIEWRNAPGWPVAYVSESLRQWGYAPADLMDGQVVYNDLFHPDDVVRVNEEIAHYFEHGPDEYRQEYRLRCADGEWVWVDDRTGLERDAHGEVSRISGILLDITVQKLAQQAQAEQTQMMRLFYEMPFIGMAITSPVDKRWLQVNDRLCEILGYPREELLQLPWTDITHPDDLKLNLGLFEDLQSGRIDSYGLQKRFVRQNGEVVSTQISVRPLRNPDGGIRHLFTTIQDITEQLRASSELGRQRDRLERAESMARLGSWSFDPDTQEGWWSPQMFRNMGLTPGLQAPPPEAFLERIHPDDRPAVAADMQSMFQGASVGDIEFRSNPENGQVRWFRGTVRRQERDVAQLPIYTGTLLDITPIKQAEEQLRRANEVLEQRVAERTAQLSEANHELEAFSYTVSHDLRAPLRGIDGYSQLLQEEYGPRLDEEGQHFVQRIRAGITLMGELISDLLDYSHLDRRTMGMDTVEVATVIDRVLEMYRPEIERNDIAVVRDVESLTLKLDREGLNLALRNLVGNALKFSRGRPQAGIEIGAKRQDDHCLIWVKDHGVGFDMQYHDRIFGIFQRLHRAEDYPGTGVGLALVAKAVQRMGGRVWAQSEPGQGATFFLEFPV